ncbi:PilN domain-containing protein [Spiribacter insolitus]|uniref:PilN domain-containing protein n=1 Tax=Spiribacter insolitus TaxID=3122417 RepID=A0ABV3T5Y5_9GAMM
MAGDFNLFREKRTLHQDQSGIHFAQSSVALSVLSEDGARVELCVNRPCGREDAAAVLADLVAEHGLRGTPAYVTLSRGDYDTQYVDLPGISDAELRDALQWRVTPPGVMSADEIVATGIRLSNDRAGGTDGAPLVRATVMPRSTLDRITDAVLGAGLDLRAVFPRETALITLARRGVSHEAAATGRDDPEPPVLSVFVGPRSTGIAIARDNNLYLSRTLQMEVASEAGLTTSQQELLVNECLRTAENFNKRLSTVALTDACIGPAFHGMDEVRQALTEALGIECRVLSLPPDIEPADESTAATAATPQGMLAVAGTLDVSLPENASLYRRPPKTRSATSPAVLTAGLAAATAGLVVITGIQSLLLNSGQQQLDAAQRERDALQEQVASLQAETEGIENVEPSPELIAERDRIERRRAFYVTILDDFEGVDTSLKEGFSGPLQALAQTPVDGLWLHEIAIDADDVTLRGHALSPFEAETLADRLESQPAFSDWSPESIDIGEPVAQGNDITARAFTIRGDGLLAVAAPRKTDNNRSTQEATGLQALLQGLRNSNE